MPDLIHSLRNCDIGYLRIVAGLWGVELASAETEQASKELTAALLAPGFVGEVVGALPAEVQSALTALAEAGGKMPWAAFSRRFGEIREAGPGRRDRERIYLNPVSAAEVLFYRALMLRAFFDTSTGPQEFAYIPEDLFALVKREGLKTFFTPTLLLTGEEKGAREEALGRPATPKEYPCFIPATDHLLDDATTFLAALRMGIPPPETQISAEVIRLLVEVAGITVKGSLQAGAVKKFLEMPRGEALSLLTRAWQASEVFNELRLLPGLQCEGGWTNQSLATRQFVLGLLEVIPTGKWWSLASFVGGIKEKFPDFQRPAGDYDSWFIKRASEGTYLRGFISWDEVDGALIRYFLTGPLFWLGKVDLATAKEGAAATAFWRKEKQIASNETGRLTVTSTGRIIVPGLVPRATRYLIARFCEWDEEKPEEYCYRVSTRSLKKAAEQGLKVAQLLPLLARNAAAEIPPAFVKSLKRWEVKGTEARMETQVVLKVSRPGVLEELRKSKAGRFLGESLGPAAAVVRPGARSNVLAALAELGLLAEIVQESESRISNNQ